MRDLIFALLMQAAQITGLPVPDNPQLRVAWEDECKIQRDFGQQGPCIRRGQPGLRVLGYYNPPTDTLHLPITFDPDDINDRATMFHELVHYLQDQANVTFRCVEHFEKQAYDAMFEYMRLNGIAFPAQFLSITPVNYAVLTTCPSVQEYMRGSNKEGMK